MMAGCANGAGAERRTAFDALVQESRSRIYGRAYRMLQNASEAEDVTQEALIKAWLSFPQFDGRNWDAWLHRIVTNTALSRMETHGIEGEIQVTAATYACLRQRYRLQARGPIAVKGRGEIHSYLLLGRKEGVTNKMQKRGVDISKIDSYNHNGLSEGRPDCRFSLPGEKGRLSTLSQA